MLRLAVIHQLVLSLLIGPMLCCCTAARIGEAKASNGLHIPAKKTCCSHTKSHVTGSRIDGDGKKPVTPSKCPCKDSGKAYAKDVVVETISTTATLASAQESQFLTLAVANVPKVCCGLGVNVGKFDNTHDSHQMTARILYAHHNLRC